MRRAESTSSRRRGKAVSATLSGLSILGQYLIVLAIIVVAFGAIALVKWRYAVAMYGDGTCAFKHCVGVQIQAQPGGDP